MSTRRVRLHRVFIRTDYNPDDPEYLGALSAPFMDDDNAEIVGVDWSVPGEVEVTYLEADTGTGPR